MSAACAGVRAPLWDAYVDGENEHDRMVRQGRALAICARCDVRALCAATTDLKHDDGVRGGLVLPTIHDSQRRAWEDYQPGRGGLARVLAISA